ncbi:MAG: class I SAM-dependent methyltransferase [Fibrobacterota bacterium]|nr:class I SAM-dependent methyltransferase [Chitinispirillaceae bacterium]
MSEQESKEKALWSEVAGRFGSETITLGNHWSYNLRNDPKRLAFVLSRYKFSAKMCRQGSTVLELGCSEGIGVPILSEFASEYTGVDMDKEAIDSASFNWPQGNVRFVNDDFLGKTYGSFDAVISLDVIEHIDHSIEHLFFKTVYDNLDIDGIAMIGTPNVTSSHYASAASQSGHINLFDYDRLRNTMQQLFTNVFMFGGNDEVVHTGFAPMSHYLYALGCGKKDRYTYVK